MSEYITNREYRQKVLKEIIRELHNGRTADEVKARFEALIQGVSAAEIAEMEQALVHEGMPVSEIQKLCDVHAAVFQGSVMEIHRADKPEETPGHPVNTFKLENREIEKRIERIRQLTGQLRSGGEAQAPALAGALEELLSVDRHYARKENLLFPYLEKNGITAPPKVMWGVDDEIRAALKEALRLLKNGPNDAVLAAGKAEEAVRQASEMIAKEENILFPMALESLTEDEWLRIRDDGDEIGYSFITPDGSWKPMKADVEGELRAQGEKPAEGGYIRFEPGLLSPEEIKGILNTLPVDITFVDKTGAVKYFSQTKDRVFARPASIIGRQVANCHPPASVHVVEKIAEELRTGKKDHEDFWIKMGGKYVYIRYFAVRNDAGDYLGIMETTQDIAPIQGITGEKRLMSE